jgi:hypothetical protein
MPGKNDIVTEQLAQIRNDLRDLWVSLTTDPKERARKERAWMLLSGALTAATTMAARQLATKLWMRLTGELPPPVEDAAHEAAKLRQGIGV